MGFHDFVTFGGYDEMNEMIFLYWIVFNLSNDLIDANIFFVNEFQIL